MIWLFACHHDELAATHAFLATRAPFERPIDDGLAVSGGSSEKDCAACHADIAREWSVSTHAFAWKDRQFQAEITKSDDRWLCFDCHTPLLVQQEKWPTGLVDNDVEKPILVPSPSFDAALRDEGVTCAACHVRDGVVHGPGLGGNAPHAVVADDAYRSGQICLRCHEAVATYDGKAFACAFATGDEAKAQPKTCPECHMPTIERPAADGGPTRTVREHFWRGAGLFKVAGVGPPESANPPGLELSAEPVAGKLRVHLHNRAGHDLPTGDPERWVQVDVTFADAAGKVLDTHPIRIGQRWQWFPVAKKLDDDRLAPDERRDVDLDVPVGTKTATLVATSHRMNPEAAAYHHLDDGTYPLSVETAHETINF